MGSKRIGVVSGRYPASVFASHINHRAYCAHRGYTYVHCNWPTGQANRYFNKIEYIRSYYHLFDYLFWIDDDAFFMNFEQRLEEFLPEPGQFLSICGSPTSKQIHTYVSSGQFMLACTATGCSFMDAVGQVDLGRVRAWWNESLGYFSNGDQDAMVYLLKCDPRFDKYQRFEYQAFNSRIEDLLAGRPVFVLHFTGTVPVKRTNYRKAQQRLGRGPSLLPSEVERALRLERPKRSFLQRLAAFRLLK